MRTMFINKQMNTHCLRKCIVELRSIVIRVIIKWRWWSITKLLKGKDLKSVLTTINYKIEFNWIITIIRRSNLFF